MFGKIRRRSIYLAAVWSLATAGPAAHGAPDEATQPPSAKLVLLGTGGGPLIRADRARPASILVVGSSRYLIDFGVDAMRRLTQAGFAAQDIDAVFFTHHHLDHNGGLADLINYSSFGQRERPVNIVGPHGTKIMVHAAIEYIATPRRIFMSEGLATSPNPRAIFVARDIAGPGEIYRDNKIVVTAAENSHFTSMTIGTKLHGKDRSFSYRFETPGGVVVFTGDTGPSKELENLAQGADYLVAEVIDVPSTMALAAKMNFSAQKLKRIEEHMVLEHLTPKALGEMASRAKVKAVVLTHYSPGLEDEDPQALYVRRIKEVFCGPVIAGRDLLEIPLAAGKPDGTRKSCDD